MTVQTANILKEVVDTVEQELLARVCAGDTKAFELLYKREAGKVFALSLRLMGVRAIAEELTQEVFVLAWRKIEQFRGESKFSTWLYRLTTNLALDRLRLKKHAFESNTAELDENLPAYQTDLDGVRDLDAAIQRLPDGARAVLVLYEIEGHSHEYIAESLGIAVGTSKAQLHRAKKLLKQWLSA